jgi:hypothetical protein
MTYRRLMIQRPRRQLVSSSDDKVKGILAGIKARPWSGSEPPTREQRDRAAKANIGRGLDLLRGAFDDDDGYGDTPDDARRDIARGKGIIQAFNAAGGDAAAAAREAAFESDEDRAVRIATEQEIAIRKGIERNQRRRHRRH